MPFDKIKIREIINEIENRFPVDKWKINGFHIWPLVRLRFSIEMEFADRPDTNIVPSNIFILEALRNIRWALKSFISYCHAYITDFKNNAEANSPVDVLFLTHGVHRTFIKGQSYSTFCDPFIDSYLSMKMKFLVLEASPNAEYRLPRHRTSKFIQHIILLICIKNKIFRKRIDSKKENLEGYNDLITFIGTKNYGVNIYEVKWIRFLANVILDLSDYFQSILKTLKPSIVFIVDYYSFFGSALMLSCRKLGIKSVDIQHGLQGEFHTAYGYFHKLPEQGYEVLPSVFWCWSSHEANTVLKWNKQVSTFHQPFIGGNLWMNLWKDEDSDIVKYYDHKIRQYKPNDSNAILLLFTPGLVSDIKEWILQAIKMSLPSYIWWLRIHPSHLDQRGNIRRLLDRYNLNHVVLDPATDLPLPALLRQIDVNITASSTTIIDAEQFGVPSILIDPLYAIYFADQISSGNTIEAYSGDNFLHAIEKQIVKKREMQRKLVLSPIDNKDVIAKFLSTHGR